MRTFHSTVLCLAALLLVACDPPTVLLRTAQIEVSAAERPPDRLVVFAKPATRSGFVDVHYRVNGGPQRNLRMSEKKGRWRYTVDGLNAGDRVDVFVTYERGGAAHDTPWLTWTYRADDPPPSPTPTPRATPRPTATSTPRATATPPAPTPRPTAIPPRGDAAEPLTPTDYTHRVTFDGATATLHVVPFSALGDSTATFRLDGGSERTVPLSQRGNEWVADVPASAGATVRYSFFLRMSDGENSLFLRSATFEATVGAPADTRSAPLIVETAGRFRDRHENERRFEPFIAGYFEASTFAVLLLDFGDALDVTVAVADEAEFVDIKLFDTNPTPPHLRADEVRADYRVAARMLAHDDPETGARTWHWRQERNPARDVDLAPGELVDLEFTIRRVQGQAVHGGSNGQYYTAIFRHRMGEPGLTEVLTSPFSRPGDATSVYVVSEPEWSFAQAARNLDHEGLVTFLRGKRLFDRDLAAEAPDALGPRFDATSCVACHPRDGSAAPSDDTSSTPGLTVGVAGSGTPHPAYGRQLQRRSAPGWSAEGRLTLEWPGATDALGDGTPYELVRPVPSLSTLAFGAISTDRITLRVAPRLIGLGLLEAVADETIVAGADPLDADGDGVSGRVRTVWDDAAGREATGRFGWKADAASLRQQVARAYLLDLGATTTVFPVDAETPANPAPPGPVEIPAGDLDDVTSYIATLGVPMRLDADAPEVGRGFATFVDLGCAACHTPTLVTGEETPHVALRSRVIHPFSDLLLHDMGDGLADPTASDPDLAREWRTAPLWGLGRTEIVSGHSRFLHDGRARSVLEAILWHDGEARSSRDRFAALDGEERAALLRFLGSL